MRQHLLQRAARPTGCGSADLPHMNTKDAWLFFKRLMHSGDLHSAKVSHKVTRYFTTATAAHKYLERHRSKAPPRNLSAAAATNANTRANWDAASPVITAATRVTICPAPQGRLAGACPPDRAVPMREGSLDYQRHMARYKTPEAAP